MKINKLHVTVSFIAGVLAALLAVSIVYVSVLTDSFQSRIYAAGPVSVTYRKDGKYLASAETSLHPDFLVPLTYKEKVYFGKVSGEEFIDISVKLTANIRIYPYTEDSVILEYEPREFGFTERYVVPYHGFEYYMRELYRLTGNADFNVYPKPEK